MRRICILLPLLVILAALFAGCSDPQRNADLILINGKIITTDRNFSIAQAVAIHKDRIVAVGSNEEIRKWAGKGTGIIDLRGQTVIPGLIDAHAHPETASISEIDGEIPDVHTIGDLLSWIRVQARQKKAGEWIIFPKLFFTRLAEMRQPLLSALDSAAPHHPVFLNGSYGGMVNTEALRLSGISDSIADEGMIREKKTGMLTGFIRASAFKYLKLPVKEKITPDQKEQALLSMLKQYNRYGITSVCSGSGDIESYNMYRMLSNRHLLTTRIFQNILLNPGTDFTADTISAALKKMGVVTGDGDAMVRIGALKIILDGGILTGTAYLREPWGKNAGRIFSIDDTSYRGKINYSRAELLAIVTAANELNWKFTAHCTGGGGVDLLLDVFEEVNRKKPINSRRFSIIHGNFFTASAIRRMKALGVYADMQPAWFYKDADAMQLILGEKRIQTFHPYRSLIEAGVMVNGGSDHMVKTDASTAVNPYHPFLAMWSIITRTTERGHIIVPSEAISRRQALEMYTINNAYASFEESEKGSIESGKLADMAVLNKDFLLCATSEIRDIQSDLTIMGGKIVYSSGKLAAAR